MTKKFIKYQLPLISWVAFIFLLCSTPGNKIPHVSWLELLSFDKFVHASVFFILTHLSVRTLIVKSNFKTVVVTLLCIFYGGILEVMQSYYFEQRSGDVLDFIANSIGCIIAVLSFSKVKKTVLKINSKSY